MSEDLVQQELAIRAPPVGTQWRYYILLNV